MKLIVITSDEDVPNEHEKLVELFEAGMKNLHIRKPKYSLSKMSKYINRIPKEYHGKIIIHSHHILALRFKLKGIHFTENHRKNLALSTLRYVIFKFLRPGLQ